MARKKPAPAKAGGRWTALVRREPHAVPSPAGPFELMRRFSGEMDGLFGQFGPRWLTSPFRFEAPTGWSPQIDVFECEGHLVVRADVPGLAPEDVKVELTDDAVVIEGEHREQHEEKRGSVYRSECQYGRFYRSVPLPRGVKTEQAEATFKNGVLEVVMPAPGLSRGRRIEIKEV